MELVDSASMKLFDVIDQSASAREVGLQLRDTTLVIVGSPTAGTLCPRLSPPSTCIPKCWYGQTRKLFEEPPAADGFRSDPDGHRIGDGQTRRLEPVEDQPHCHRTFSDRSRNPFD